MPSNTEPSQCCPICSAQIAYWPRYPRMLCLECAKRACTADGRPLEFFNQDLFGGVIGLYADTQESHQEVDCYVDGIHCRAEEGRFGGVVIQAVDST